MIKEVLEGYLFRNDAYTYAVLDGASIDDLPRRLFELDPPRECLYSGDLGDDLVHVAPYLVLLFPGEPFTDWLLTECWGKHYGIFAQSVSSLTSMRRHFRTLLTVHGPDGDPMLFRYYDPRVLVQYLLTCNINEIEIVFGPIKYLFAELPKASELVRYGKDGEHLLETRLKINPGK